MAKRSYDQYCAVARGLDVIGERWTVLIVRELLLGPKRYRDLLVALAGIGTNLLAQRLRDMESEGLLERVILPPPAGSAAYQLTESGRGLESVLLALGRWGARFMAERREGDRITAGAYFIALRARFRPELAAGLSETYGFHVDGRVFEVRIDRGECITSEGHATSPTATFTMDADTLNDLFFARVSSNEALASGRVKVIGDSEALTRFMELFPRPQAAA